MLKLVIIFVVIGGNMEIIDVKFKEGKYDFHYRVVGIITKDDKYFIQNIEGKDYFVLPGGHVRAGENSDNALIREIKEEVEIDIMKEDFRLVCYHENIYEKNNRIEHWIEQYYLIDVKGKLEKDNWSYIEHDIDGVKKLNYMFVNKEELEKIVLAADGVMIARGDMAYEVAPEVVPIIQRKAVALCRKHGKISIVATQTMGSMVDNPQPSRAEVSDVANAVIQGADVVMLSDESATGKYPEETVKAMRDVIMYTQEHAAVSPIDDIVERGEDEALNAISLAAVELAEQIDADALIVETKSGQTAATVAANRPALPIYAVTSSSRVAQQLGLNYATRSFIRPDGEFAGLELAKELKANGTFGSKENITVVIVSGRQPGLVGGTDTIRVRTV